MINHGPELPYLHLKLTSYLLTAFGLMLILEGLLPLLVPQVWRETFQRLTTLKDGQLRFVGLVSIVGGLIVLWIIH